MRAPRTHRLAAVTAMAVCLGGLQVGTASAGKKDLPPVDGIAVKLDGQGGTSLENVLSSFPVRTDSTLLASRGIYLLQPTDEHVANNPKETAKLAQEIDNHQGVDYAEANYGTSVSDQRGYHAWPNGVPIASGGDAAWRTQDLTHELDLSDAHRVSTGSGVIVAVLDTGSDASHPVLSGRTVGGYDYIGDDAWPDEERQEADTNENGTVDDAFGHGTFVSGTVLLVAPDAKVMPMRVLDSDGVGDTFVLAAAITDAIDNGADVINLSLGTVDNVESKVLEETLKDAKKSNVVIVASAGNEASQSASYPASDKEVLSVASTGEDSSVISDFSNYGDRVDVAATGERVVGPMPDRGFAVWSGTSMAAPQVSAQLSLMRSAGGTSDAKKQREGVTKTARKVRGHHKIKSGEINVVYSIEKARR